MDFGEEGEPKGFCWVNLARGQTTYQFVELNARPFVTIRVDVRGFPDPMRAIINEVNRYDVEGAVVRVIITALPENEPLIRDRDIETAPRQGGLISRLSYMRLTDKSEDDWALRTLKSLPLLSCWSAT